MILAENLSLLRGGRPLFEKAAFTIHPGWHVGLTGNNGCGKSSLFALLRRELQADTGSLQRPAIWTVAHMAQEVAARDDELDARRVEVRRRGRGLEAAAREARRAAFSKVRADAIALLVADRDQHVGGHADGEQQVPVAHVGRRPEGDEEAGVERVGDPAVEEGRSQLVRLRLPIAG